MNYIWDIVKKRKIDNFLAVGVNCVNPRYVTPLFKAVNGMRADADKIPLVVYPNSGEVYNVDDGWCGKEDCVPLEVYLPEWINLGAKIVGGCCRTYARDIKRIRQVVDDIHQAKVTA